jgi:peptidoglycan/xylan/chitin deacetylase (PgdA/CDA1 family)
MNPLRSIHLMSGALRAALHRLARAVQPVCNVYTLIVNLLPQGKARRLRFLGATISPETTLHGMVSIADPRLVTLSGPCTVTTLRMANRGQLLYAEGPLQCSNLSPAHDTIITPAMTWQGNELTPKTVTLSIDLEGGVGLCHAERSAWHALQPHWNSVPAARRIMSLLQSYRIPCTWAVCGHLFLDGCSGKHPFDEHDWFGDWFTYDPARTAGEDDAWYMPGLIRDLAANPLFEIGYHTFGHFNYQRASAATITEDLRQAQVLRDATNLPLRSFVYPYNAVNHVSEVVRAGFTALRGYLASNAPKSVDFGSFRMYNTTHSLAPETFSETMRVIPRLAGRNYNFFTHCFSWKTEQDFAQLESILQALESARSAGTICIERLGDAR